MRMEFSVILVLLTLCWGLVRPQGCPDSCLCFRTTVRCMFLQLDRVPQVPPDTTILDLRFNKIRHIPPGTFREMRSLNTLLLNNNQIQRLVDGAFEGLDELRYLYLYKNKISTIESKAFKDMPKLEQLFLHSNNLRRLPPGLFSYSNNLQRLRLDSNALICDCEMVWLAEMLKKNIAHTQAAATCDLPGNLKGRSLLTINIEDFNCSTYSSSSSESDRPRFIMEPSDVEVTFGNTVYFNCRAEGSPDPEILWTHNNEIISPDQSNRYRILSDGTLMIEQARDDDEGTYECIARNAAGESKTKTAELRYRDQRQRSARPQFITRPRDVQVNVGETVEFPCSANGQPRPDITWTFNGNLVNLNTRMVVVGTGTLRISNVQVADKGQYRCQAENTAGTITADARLTVLVQPHFVLRPVDTEMTEGSTVVLQCDAMGEPTPLLTWHKDNAPLPNNGRFQILDTGRTLRIPQSILSDTGVYTCRVDSAAGGLESSANLRITTAASGPSAQRGSYVEADVGEHVTLSCNDNSITSPNYRWIKDGTILRTGRKYVVDRSRLTIRNVIFSDEGSYECFPESTLGYSRSRIRLRVYSQHSIGDPLIDEAFRQARQNVNNAIDSTQAILFNRNRTHTVQDLLASFRYPSEEALEIARAGEIFEQTLEIIHRHVEAGHQYNVSGHDKSYQDIVTPTHLALIANMSGCQRHQRPVPCTNMCFHKKYRTHDGMCNNVQNPNWGAANMAYKRLLPPIYENGFNTPVGWQRAKLYNRIHVPSPRLVSSVLISSDDVSTDDEHTHMVMQWGQFLDHDVSLTPQSVSQHRFSDGRRCNETCENDYPCFPIPVPSSDQRVHNQPCLGFARSSPICNTGTTSLFFNTFAPRQQLNVLSSYIDASNVYGSTQQFASRLRDLSNERGQLLVGPLSTQGKRLLPYDFHGLIGPADCQIETSKRYIPCFLTGDHRGNEQLGLTAMHTLWLREHNRIASELLEVNPHWDGDMLYHESRKVLGAIMQHITYEHWLPKILGPKGTQMLGPYRGYDPSVDATVANEFATAAFRFGHTIVQPIIYRLNESFQPIPEGNLPLHRAFFSPYRIVEEGGIDPLLRGMFGVGAKLRLPDELINSELTERLFALSNSIGLDLASLNIQRGRDHALPFYNQYRKFCNLTVAERFDDLSFEITDVRTRRRLETLYGHPDNVDLFVGGIVETPMPGAKVGPTFQCLIVDQFRRLRDGDRFWYENTMVFNPEQLLQIKRSSLARVICDSSDQITRVQRDVFTKVQSVDGYVPCEDIPKVDLKTWADCCTDCGKAGDFSSLTGDFQRGRSIGLQSDSPSHRDRDHRDRFANSVYNRQEIDIKMLDMESRIEGMENLINSMQHSMKGMKRKMRKMATVMGKPKCVDETGQSRQSGDSWKKDICTTCYCKYGNVKCRTESCPQPVCEFPKDMPGQCCPVC